MSIVAAIAVGLLTTSARAASTGSSAGLEAERVCRIVVQSKRKTGKVDERVFYIETDSRAACEEASRAHQPNFAPRWIESKRVSYSWGTR